MIWKYVKSVVCEMFKDGLRDFEGFAFVIQA